MLSTGTFHQRFVPVERVVHAARAAAARGNRQVRIAIEECDQQDFDAAALFAGLSAEIAAKQVFLGRDPWIVDAGGRGNAQLSHRRAISESDVDRSAGRCSQLLDTITVTPDQTLRACCGYPMEQLPRLEIGSIAEDALADVLRDAPTDLFKMWLHIAGPRGIAAFVARYLPGYDLPPSASICQSCVVLQRDTRAMAVVAAHGDELVSSITDVFIGLHGGQERLQAF